MTPSNTGTAPYHTPEQLSFFQQQASAIPIEPNEYFLTPFQCKGCHGFDSLGLANINLDSVDVNLFDDWETSMMGLSAKDPFWKAKVSHEMLVNPVHADELQTFCTRCHAPMGHYTAIYHGATSYTMADLATDSLGLAGVGCGGCHSIGPDSSSATISGMLPYDTSDVEFGPFFNPMAGPMVLYTGITPLYSEHVSKSTVCASCHTLISNVVDLNGNPTGATFVEQSTFQEWKNSVFESQGKPCQTCHMPAIEDPVKIANGFTALVGRSPFNLHQFQGGNSFMVELIKQNKVALGVDAPDANFDSTLASISKILKEETLDLVLIEDEVNSDTAFFHVELKNKAGHKFPTGYPSRRAVLQIVLTKEDGSILFSSGTFNQNGSVRNLSLPYETHYDVIRDSTEVQIYEMVLGDVNGNKTTVLERSATKLKDNRIPPLGFSMLHSTYDTCYIAGSALSDLNFNRSGATEGTGMDIVYFHIPMNGYHGLLNVSASVHYQSVPPEWLSEMFTLNSTEIDLFRGMYNTADKTPVLIALDTLQNVSIPDGIFTKRISNEITVSPNPSSNGKVMISGKGLQNIEWIEVLDVQSNLLFSQRITRNSEYISLQLPNTSGLYFLRFRGANESALKKVVRL